jgi:hypothetical protein
MDISTAASGPMWVAIKSMLLCVPMPDPTPYFAEKIEASLFGQMPEIADKIGDSVLVGCFAMSLENSDSLRCPRSSAFIGPLDQTFLRRIALALAEPNLQKRSERNDLKFGHRARNSFGRLPCA